MDKIKYFFESQAFGVCAYLGYRLHIPSRRIRMFFIYATFITLGSPVIVYLSMAFILQIKRYIKEIRNPIWDL